MVNYAVEIPSCELYGRNVPGLHYECQDCLEANLCFLCRSLKFHYSLNIFTYLIIGNSTSGASDGDQGSMGLGDEDEAGSPADNTHGELYKEDTNTLN